VINGSARPDFRAGPRIPVRLAPGAGPVLAPLMTRRSSRAVLLGLAICGASAGCSKSESTTPDAGVDPGSSPTTFGGARPVELRVPAGYDASKPAPLLLVLHGYGSGGVVNDIYMHMTSIADAMGFFYVAPDGTVDKSGKRFWNANDGCCDFDNTAIDDDAYLTSLVKEIQGAYAIDPKRIFVMGHSNGGYMANRLACDHADLFAAVASWAGANWSDPARCKPSGPIGYLQIHGTKDSSVPFGATGDAGLAYPGAAGTVAIWAQKNACASAVAPTGEMLRIDADSAGPDTKVARGGNCKANGAAELWPVEGAEHLFTFTPDAVSAIWGFLSAHAKP
jgi:polyhydroxybutyrate depolymerase